ncbi:hypothetical protein KOM03_19930 (plasmid) [Bacillus velezensis]|uniref:hypothetical protein n=1 Tax=Bacillus velezensis TaxID=492670 RepID=UPI001C0D9BA1|nr:hypothetical protein [Bacillus velezensis]QWQ49726.1 hypothetical protein KOM03_19930 [Bacillus velezensis]
MRLFPENPSDPGQRRRSAPVFLGDGSAGGEELQLKKRGQIRKTRQSIQGNAGDRRPYSWAMAAPAAKTCG